MVSQGVPMILMGDEVGRTQHGNNNAYCHDNELAWFDWRLTEENVDLLRFIRLVMQFRHAHSVLRGDRFFEHRDVVGSGRPDIRFHGTQAFWADYSPQSRCLAVELCGEHASPPDDSIYIAINMHWDGLPFQLPEAGSGRAWKVAVNTSMPSPK